jgi:hypothetical protein
MHHIPTRGEMDEVQRTVIELRRELRALKRAHEAPPAVKPRKAAAAKPRAVAKKKRGRQG